ncbi:MAG: hypothetical protein SO287_11700 [Parabacteroides sp.]|nr:hypothetical protein [Parabacteroides sp.]
MKTLIDDLLAENNNPGEKELIFNSSDHERFQNGINVSGHNYGCNRRFVINGNSNGYTVTLYNLDGVHPIWKNNIQMAPKPMRIVRITGAVVEMRGYGRDLMGGSFADYGIYIHIENNEIDAIQLNMYDRGVSIIYYK